MQESSTELFIKTLQVGPLRCNCTIIGDPVSKQAIVIGPGGDAQRIMAIVQEQGLAVSQILHTHAHFDHFLASGEMHEQTGAPLCLHQADKPLWEHLEDQCNLFGMPYKPVPAPQHWLTHEDPLPISHTPGKALFTPGHTPGSMSFWFEAANLLIAGDTLFQGGIGRTDLWGGDYATIERSIREQLYTLDEQTLVITGHGPSTTIGHELRHNPFVRPA
jgi:glyoxylase-like metal-dependent hydrolase (beta-lactamase superfamily II)